LALDEQWLFAQEATVSAATAKAKEEMYFMGPDLF